MNESNISRIVLGPRHIGGVYRSGYSGVTYRVVDVDLSIDHFPMITVCDVDGPTPGRERTHSTGWSPRDQIISEWDQEAFDRFCADPKRQALVDRILEDI